MAEMDAVEPGGSTALLGVNFDHVRIEMMDWDWGAVSALVECGRARWS